MAALVPAPESPCGLVCSLLFCSSCPLPRWAGVKETIATLAPSATVLVVDAKGNELIAQNADKPFVPASVTKIVTSWLALEVLGADYRFETRFYLDDKRVLYVKGGGDPYLISGGAGAACDRARREDRQGADHRPRG